ncbi:MAG: UbiX family flavin prenyltransferase [Candidatus Altiarchaeota archaeon]|nr:UbiX family flavin prenyltransferase [Candidatus Altiarchaeota archaeon]
MKIIVAVTGTSGVILAGRLLDSLKKHETFLVVSETARKVAEYEDVSIEAMERLANHVYAEGELDADIASSSNPVDAMVVIPCSMKTLSAIANGFSSNLITRSAENVLKTGRKLVVVPRDTPLSLAAINNMRKLRLAGALIVPPNMAYYFKPKKLDDVTNFFVGKVLDSLGLEHDLYRRWVVEDEP